ncbi:MAG: sulfite exporter TauE/SafE family protein [Candidatus Omnitrophica bacterium]|nr:sulfite exporter TauE/SafE family protein [Candidatus Omnitrophota bacterium]
MFQEFSKYLSDISILTYVIVFASGIITSFTPCVYPLIPIIIGVIGASKEKSRLKSFILSLSYVLGVAVIFSSLGVFAAITGKLFGQIQSNPIAHLMVGGIIILFALVMLDAVTLPVFMLSRAGAGKVIKGHSAFSAFFMGCISGFIAAPCAAAVLGAILAYVSTTQNIMLGFSLLFTFAIGLGAILILTGLFTGILLSFQKSQKIMIIMQKVMGLGMIILGAYFIFRAGVLSV